MKIKNCKISQQAISTILSATLYITAITGSIIFTGIYAFLTGDAAGTMILAFVSLIILYKHIENLHRIQLGTEAHISFLWKKDQEIERIKHNTN